MEMFEVLIHNVTWDIAAFSLPEVGEYVEGPDGLPIVGANNVEEPAPSQLGPGYGWLACCVSNCRVPASY